MSLIDERFLTHRLRSTSTAGILCALGALSLFSYRYFVQHRWSWDLLSVALIFIAVKLSLMTYYSLKD